MRKTFRKIFSKCDVSDILTEAESLDKLVVNGNTILPKINEEKNQHKFCLCWWT